MFKAKPKWNNYYGNTNYSVQTVLLILQKVEFVSFSTRVIYIYIHIYIYIYIYTCIYIYVYIYQLLYITESTNVCNYAEDTMFHVCDSDIRNLVSRLEHDSVLATEWLEHRHAFTKVWEGRMC